jgi:hypothetical protein
MKKAILCYPPSSTSGQNLAFRLWEENGPEEVLKRLEKAARETPEFNSPVTFIGETRKELTGLTLFGTFFGIEGVFPALLRTLKSSQEGTLILFQDLTREQQETAEELIKKAGLKGEWIADEDALQDLFS